MKQLISFSLSTLNQFSTDALYEIVDGKDYDEETKNLARRILNLRTC